MLNKQNERELAYIVRVDGIEELPGYDRVESAIVGGWHCIVPKGQFQPGSLGIYFEIDSRVPADNPAFAFMEKRNYKVKTQKMCKSISQGLLMAPEDFGWERQADGSIWNPNAGDHGRYEVGTFLTKELGVTYADAEDNTRKTNPNSDKYKKMAQRHPNIFRKKWVRFVMKYKLGRRIMFFFFGKKKDKRGWPTHIAARTDVERAQNMVYILKDKKPFVASEKVDGSSCSLMAERGRFGKIKYYVCSRNVVFTDEDAKCYYDSNIYFEAWNKYNVKEIITKILNDYNLNNVAIQCEVYGDGVQRRDYSLKNGEHKMAVFHIVSNGVKFPMNKVVEICEKYGLPHVPIVDDNYILPDTIEELQAFAESQPSQIDGLPREGIVFYDKETGQQYFKMVSPNFLLKYHQ